MAPSGHHAKTLADIAAVCGVSFCGGLTLAEVQEVVAVVSGLIGALWLFVSVTAKIIDIVRRDRVG